MLYASEKSPMEWRTDEWSEKELDEAQDRLEAIEGIKRRLESMKSRKA